MLIRHGTLVTRGQTSRTIHDGALLVRDGHIRAIADDALLAAAHPDEPVVDVAGSLVTPGLVCGRTQLTRSLARPMLPSDATSEDPWRDLAGRYDYEAIRYGTMLGSLEALRYGVTTVVDDLLPPTEITYSLDAVAEGLIQTGQRGVLSCLVSDRRGLARARQAIEENARFSRRAGTEPTLVALMGLDGLDGIAQPTLQTAFATAAMTDLGYSVHLGTFGAEARQCELSHGQRPVERLRKLRLLGPRALVGPCLGTVDEELQYLSGSGATVVYAPRHVADARQSQPAARHMIALGLPVCLGTAGYGHQMLQEAGAAYRLSRSGSTYVEALSAEQVVGMAMDAGAAYVSRLFGQKVGVLEPGALADIAIWRTPWGALLNDVNLPWFLLNGWETAFVDTVLVGGQVVLRHGRATRVDGDRIQARSVEIAQVLARTA